ncbi:MAG: hypothetical protein GX817_00150 [Elusimicrobia bacterium]|nr:hypothetical protein [Elusimicrobiota bacterium]
MDILMDLNPTILFAVLALFFALINFLLWVVVLKNTPRGKQDMSTANKGPISVDPELGKKIDKLFEEVIRIEDQLWGVLDKVRVVSGNKKRLDKIEQLLEDIKKDHSIKNLPSNRENET